MKKCTHSLWAPERKRLSLSKPNKKVLNRSINDNGKSLKEDTTEQAVVLKSGLPHDSPPKSAAGLDAYFYAFDSEIKMAPSDVSETVFDFENGLIVGLSWWGCSNADKQETDLPDEVAENSSSISVAVQTDAQRILFRN